ncbi:MULTISPECIES: CueP family metal-binding protein [Oceanobacillus]|uniref:CueP family metal-binding protein n=1 Tax=Oceanobacillus aidingensis TaxID=645964 RepID=A0ABV9JYK9_9BACI|nr:CueP family metal-binding protein [Oceanobacillus oncorhynchi]MDM8099911.1 CueP family metal-binding protein [Oceanobacillus oncorhynchi]
MEKKIILVLFGLLVLLTACSSEEDNQEGNALDETVDIKELVHHYSTEEIVDENASITSEQLIVTNDEGEEEAVYDLPEDEFFVSIAPFEQQTHPCEIHSLTGCQGEMVQEEFEVYIENAAGDVIIDETIQTGENGFIDLWLPRDETYTVEIKQDGKEVTSEISTFQDDFTCITTMQLI